MFNFYANEQDKGFAGMKANVAVDTVDSFAAEDGINPGEAVIRGTNVETQVKAVTATEDIEKIIGIAVHTHKEPSANGKYYAEGDAVPVMTSGDIYVEVNGNVKAGDTVKMSIEDGAGIFEASGTVVRNMTYMESGGAGDIIRVRIRK